MHGQGNLFFQEPQNAVVGDFVDGKVLEVKPCLCDCIALAFRDDGVRIDTEDERKEGVDEVLPLALGERREELLQHRVHGGKRGSVGSLKLDKAFQTAVLFHIKMVHAHQFEQVGAVFKAVRKERGEFAVCKRFVRRGDSGEVCDPRLIFLLHDGKEDFFFCFKVIVDRRAAEARCSADFLERDVPKAHRLVEFPTGIDDFLPPVLGAFV